jgi:hypothetical protein
MTDWLYSFLCIPDKCAQTGCTAFCAHQTNVVQNLIVQAGKPGAYQPIAQLQQVSM